MLSLWVVRHGETDWNITGRVQGWTDIPLNAMGEAQAHQLGTALQGVSFATILSSDLVRAARTAEILSGYVNAAVQTDTRLRERHFGSAEGMIRADSELRFPQDAPDAEPLPTLDKRASEWLNWVRTTYPNRRLLCTTHGGFVRALVRATFARDIPSPPNTSVTRLDWKGNQWVLRAVGSTTHLDPIIRQEI